MIATVWIEAGVAPIILWHFGELSLLGVLSNVVILWLVPYLTWAAFAVGVTIGVVSIAPFFILEMITKLVIILTQLLVFLFLFLVEQLARLGPFSLDLHPQWWQILAWYLGMVMVWFEVRRKKTSYSSMETTTKKTPMG